MSDNPDAIWESMHARPIAGKQEITVEELNQVRIYRLKEHGAPKGSPGTETYACICGLAIPLCEAMKASVERTERAMRKKVEEEKENKPKGRNSFYGKKK